MTIESGPLGVRSDAHADRWCLEKDLSATTRVVVVEVRVRSIDEMWLQGGRVFVGWGSVQEKVVVWGRCRAPHGRWSLQGAERRPRFWAKPTRRARRRRLRRPTSTPYALPEFSVVKVGGQTCKRPCWRRLVRDCWTGGSRAACANCLPSQTVVLTGPPTGMDLPFRRRPNICTVRELECSVVRPTNNRACLPDLVSLAWQSLDENMLSVLGWHMPERRVYRRGPSLPVGLSNPIGFARGLVRAHRTNTTPKTARRIGAPSFPAKPPAQPAASLHSSPLLGHTVTHLGLVHRNVRTKAISSSCCGPCGCSCSCRCGAHPKVGSQTVAGNTV
jgi:hypothetical protein